MDALFDFSRQEYIDEEFGVHVERFVARLMPRLPSTMLVKPTPWDTSVWYYVAGGADYSVVSLKVRECSMCFKLYEEVPTPEKVCCPKELAEEAKDMEVDFAEYIPEFYVEREVYAVWSKDNEAYEEGDTPTLGETEEEQIPVWADVYKAEHVAHDLQRQELMSGYPYDGDNRTFLPSYSISTALLAEDFVVFTYHSQNQGHRVCGFNGGNPKGAFVRLCVKHHERTNAPIQTLEGLQLVTSDLRDPLIGFAEDAACELTS